MHLVNLYGAVETIYLLVCDLYFFFAICEMLLLLQLIHELHDHQSLHDDQILGHQILKNKSHHH